MQIFEAQPSIMADQNLDYCDLATSMHHMIRFQISNTFLNFLQKYGVQHEFIAN